MIRVALLQPTTRLSRTFCFSSGCSGGQAGSLDFVEAPGYSLAHVHWLFLPEELGLSAVPTQRGFPENQDRRLVASSDERTGDAACRFCVACVSVVTARDEDVRSELSCSRRIWSIAGWSRAKQASSAARAFWRRFGGTCLFGHPPAQTSNLFRRRRRSDSRWLFAAHQGVLGAALHAASPNSQTSRMA